MKTRPSAEVWCDALDEGIDLLKKAEGLVRYPAPPQAWCVNV